MGIFCLLTASKAKCVVFSDILVFSYYLRKICVTHYLFQTYFLHFMQFAHLVDVQTICRYLLTTLCMITYQTSLILKLDFIYRWKIETNSWSIAFQSGHTERQTIILIIIISMPPVIFSYPTLVRYIFYFIFITYKGTDKRFICYNGHPSTMAVW